ncbi:MAG: hypothetical protein HYW01_03465 [Deltaproteobacteria bacterium]|nr:hypothetical protein [Deltaproteobacteria bacterium]
MIMFKNFLLFLTMVLFATTAYLNELDTKDNTSPLGFKFGISKKQAEQIIKSKGKKIVEKTVDSKEIKTIMIEGTIVKLPLGHSYSDLQTRLEFYDDELMSSSLIFKSDDSSKKEELEAELSSFLGDLYGQPAEVEDVLDFTTLTWHIPDLKVVLSTNPNNNVTKVQYIYEPVNQSRVDKEIQLKQKGKPEDPAKKMFIDGNYSAPNRPF